MECELKYTVFRVRWGYFGLIGGKNGLVRSCLPIGSKQEVKRRLLDGLAEYEFQEGFQRALQDKVIGYFEGKRVDFADVRIDWGGVSSFLRDVLGACRRVSYGKQIGYGELAGLAGRKGAARAVGNVLGANQVPLIVPCHRVVCADGRIGGFMRGMEGAVDLKKRMLELEQAKK